jgi:hypothetical protein
MAILQKNWPARTPSAELRREEKFLQHRGDLAKLPGEAVAVLMSLIEAIGGDGMIVKILSKERPDLPVLLDPVEKVLERHGWTTGGFLSPPDRLLLLRDLQAIVGHGLGSYRKFKVEAPKEESLAGSLISDLIKSLEPETADGAV